MVNSLSFPLTRRKTTAASRADCLKPSPEAMLAGLFCGTALWDGAAGKGSSGQLLVVNPTSPPSYLPSTFTSMYLDTEWDQHFGLFYGGGAC